MLKPSLRKRKNFPFNPIEWLTDRLDFDYSRPETGTSSIDWA
jgi:hypothetical protein